MGTSSTSLLGLSLELNEIIQVNTSTEPGANECLLNVSYFYSKFLRHHFIGIASQLSFEEGIIVMAILQMGKWKFRKEKPRLHYYQQLPLGPNTKAPVFLGGFRSLGEAGSLLTPLPLTYRQEENPGVDLFASNLPFP